MNPRAFPRSAKREWLVAACAYTLLVAPFGCEIQTQLLDALGDLDDASGVGPSSTGLFLNAGDGPVVASGRSVAGDAFFVFGTRDAQGALASVESIFVRTADGGESFIAFEAGLPVHAQGPDGSYAHIAYQELSNQRVAASVELYDAPTESKSTYAVEVDLAQTAERVAELVASVTGRALETPKVSSESVSKQDDRSVRITIFSPLFALLVIPLVVAVHLTIVVLGQVLAAIFTVVLVAVQLTLLAAFLPVFLIASLLSGALIRIEFVPLFDVFATLPPPPVIVLL